MFPEFPEFRTLELQDRESLAPWLAEAPQPTCDLSFANLHLWRDCETARISLLNGNACILLEPHSEAPYFLEPLGGNRPVETVRACLEHSGRISRAGEALIGRLPAEEFHAEPLRDHSDYLYRVADLAELRGKRYDGKRNQIRRFTRRHSDYEFRVLEKMHMNRALELFERWSNEREEPHSPKTPPGLTRICQLKVLHRAAEAFEELELIGGALFVEGNLQAFIVGSELRSDTAVAHIQYADASIPGIYQTMLWEACRRLFGIYAHINLEEDLGIPGLRKTKLSYQPLRIEPKFEITLRPPQ